MNAIVSKPKIAACTTPTNISYKIIGIGRKNAKNAPSDASMTSPTNILPKSRKENEMTFVNSEINSKRPVYAANGFREKNLLKYDFKPSV